MPSVPIPKKKRYSLRLDPESARLLKELKFRDGISESEQIRRALRLWFEQKGVLEKAKPKDGRR
jgi:Arc/MetJ-type ribon-helix-helix transcriptional regulator